MSFNINGFNVGTDFSATVLSNIGITFPLDNFGLLMEADMESMDREIDVVPISGGGVPVFQTIWAGLRGRFMFTRQNGNLQQAIADLMAAYHGAGIIPNFTVMCSVLNRDGSIDEYILTGVQFSKPRFGNFRSEKEVDMQIEFRASLMVTTGSAATFLGSVLSAGLSL